MIGLEQLVHEDANGAFERMQHVVERYDRMRHEMSPEELEVLFRAAIGVIAVDPQEPDRSIPTFIIRLQRLRIIDVRYPTWALMPPIASIRSSVASFYPRGSSPPSVLAGTDRMRSTALGGFVLSKSIRGISTLPTPREARKGLHL